ncbi:MAG: long-chain fatty acid--CoA ligase [Thermoleophilia bacterium]|nr:long-chain fatty acid--CoA ligase [Thermoleophilia bacterium]
MSPANLAAALTEAAATHPGQPALRLGDATVTYEQFDAVAARVAGLLRDRGIGPGDRVGIMLPNVPAFPACYYGVLRAGAVVVPMNVLLKRREVAYYLGDSGASLLFAWHAFGDEAGPGADDAGTPALLVGDDGLAPLLVDVEPAPADAERSGDDPAVILYTSGTTGRPKGAQLSHANMRSNAAVCVSLFGLDTTSVILGALPLFHSFGQTCGLNAAVAAGATLALLPRFDPVAALDVIAREGVTVFEGVPTMYGALLAVPPDARPDTSSLQVCASGGASLPVEVLHSFEREFGCAVLEGYGLSETSPVASFNHPDRERKAGSIGTPIDGVEMRVVDEAGVDVPAGEVGEILIRGRNLMTGYWEQPEATAAAIRDGWFWTGDLGRRDEDGYYFIVDRSKDLIIRGGYNVYPREVEEVLYEHAAVAEAAVVGVPHAELGQEVGAAVALKPDAAATEDELRAFVRERIAAYKYPRHVWFVDALPKGPTGKIVKREIELPDVG